MLLAEIYIYIYVCMYLSVLKYLYSLEVVEGGLTQICFLLGCCHTLEQRNLTTEVTEP